jgi:transposase
VEATDPHLVTADQVLPKKQRHTARRIWQRLVDEHGAELGESTVSGYVAQLRRELSGGVACVTVPQVHPPGEEAEVDFGELWVWLEGTLTKVWMFVLRLSASGRAFHVAFASQAAEAFLEGHVLAFQALGGVPRRIRYDNLRAAVDRILPGRDRVENQRFIALRSHYGFDSFFCQPGKRGAHEKGGVEGEIGRFRRRHLVPIPVVTTMSELNEHLAAAGRADDDRHIGNRRTTVGRTSPPSGRTCCRGQPSGSIPHGCRPRGSTTRPGSACGSAITRCRPGWPGGR